MDVADVANSHPDLAADRAASRDHRHAAALNPQVTRHGGESPVARANDDSLEPVCNVFSQHLQERAVGAVVAGLPDNASPAPAEARGQGAASVAGPDDDQRLSSYRGHAFESVSQGGYGVDAACRTAEEVLHVYDVEFAPRRAARTAVMAHGGKVAVHRYTSQGTRFEFTSRIDLAGEGLAEKPPGRGRATQRRKAQSVTQGASPSCPSGLGAGASTRRRRWWLRTSVHGHRNTLEELFGVQL